MLSCLVRPLPGRNLYGVCPLPLLYPVAIPSFLGTPRTEQGHEAIHSVNNRPDTSDEQIRDKQPYRLTLFSIAVLISLYPFLSQSFRTWAPSQIGEGKGHDGATCVTALPTNGGLSRLCVLLVVSTAMMLITFPPISYLNKPYYNSVWHFFALSTYNYITFAPTSPAQLASQPEASL